MINKKSSLDPEVLSRLLSLEDPGRRRLYEYVLTGEQPAGRDQAAAATGMSRALAAYHLDKLVEAGLLSASYARPPGRSGPGAGRPSKVYSRTQKELALSVPPRDYELLARLLIASVDRDPTGAVHEAVNQAAYNTGQHIGADPDRNLIEALNGCGYQPRPTDDGRIELCNCPFHALAQAHQDIVCDLNLHLIQGVLDGGTQQDARAELAFHPNRCCVVIHNARAAPSPSPDAGGNRSHSSRAGRRAASNGQDS